MTTGFNAFGLAPKLMQALGRMNFTVPTPIQAAAIPLALAGRDVLGSAQTGTGKTGAYGIPLIVKLLENPHAVALVLTPTRELATQVIAALHKMIPDFCIRTALLIGGAPMSKQLRQLQARPRLIVGTPGRINDHLARRSVNLSHVCFAVLDETDRMLDMGFAPQIEKILAATSKNRQTLMFSATLPQGIARLSAKYLNNPERVSVGSTVAAAPNIEQQLVHVTDAEKYPALLALLKDHSRTALIFVKTKWGSEKLAGKLSRLNISAEAIHGDLRQNRRDKIIRDYRDRRFQVLVATDLAARGLDVPHIELVINYDLPQCPEDYIHRIGRTARAGAAGKAVTLLTPADGSKWHAIRRLMNPGAGGKHEGGAPENRNRPKHRNKRRFSGKSDWPRGKNQNLTRAA